MNTTINKTEQIVARFASQNYSQIELASVHAKGQHVEATDRYSFIRITTKDADRPEALLDGKEISAVKFDKGAKLAIAVIKDWDVRDFKYPDVTPILENVTKQKEYTEVLLDPVQLLKVVKGLHDLSKGGKLPRVTLRVAHTFNVPVSFTTQTGDGSDVLALLMPCRNV